MASMSAQSRVRSNIALKAASSTGPSTGILVPANGHRPPMARCVRVQRDVVEEQVDGRLVPPQADLALGRDGLLRSRRLCDLGRQRTQQAAGIGSGYEHVDVDVARGAGVESPVRERDRAAEGVWDPPPRECAVQRDKPFGEGHRDRDASRGNRSSAR